MSAPVVVAVMGTTATGKSDLGLWLAERFGGEIVSADSAQVYRGLDIGTAKPSLEERALVPHHGIDVVDPDQEFSLADFQRLASRAVEEIHSHGKPAFLVGGTGLYVRGLLEGYRLAQAPPDPDLRRQLGCLSLSELVDRLGELDLVALERVDRKNPRRVMRAIEICLTDRGPLPESGGREDPGYRALKLGLRMSRERLNARIDLRAERMVQEGLLEEVRRLVEKGYRPHLQRLKLIGYPEMLDVLEGRLTLRQAVEELKKNTRRFSKRQMTWLRSERDLHWIDLDHAADGGRCMAAGLVGEFLGV
ncbi:MAG: tRNA (adenosine(37)-N6)-dimethylallyltransferase MiaA [Armatimonadetes bacterium]|nr:tRNA (adenosine(37)-N6)-dimethylallyltransferase MiaA [Armatimonadota bacterium]